MIIYYLLSRKICIRNVRQTRRNRCNFANLFRSKIQSLYIVQARTVQLNSNAIEKKKGKKGFACDRLQTYSTPDGFAILVDERSHSGQALPSVTDATRAAGWRKPAAVSIPPPSGSFDARNCAVAHETVCDDFITRH